jgi:hypothetical protein
LDEVVIRWSKVLAIGLVLYAAVVLGFLVFGYSGGRLVAEDIYLIPAITGTVIGAFLTVKRPDNRMGPLMAVMAAALVTLGLSNVLVPWTLQQGSDALVVVAVQLSDLAWVTQFVTALVLLPLWFPTGRPLDRRWAWLGRIAVVAALLSEISFFLSETACAYESTMAEECVVVDNPWGISGFAGFESLLLVTFLMALAAIASTFVRWRRSDDVERHQIKWFFVAAVALLIAFVISFLDINLTLNNVAFALGLTAVWVSIAIAVLKYRLYDIDRIISRTVAYAVVIGVLAAIYAGLVTAIGSRFAGSLPVAASTLAVAALFNPLRRRVQAWVDRHFNRSAYDTEQVMHEFVRSLRDEVHTDEVVGGWVEVVDSTMQPSSVGVWVKEPE